MPYDPCRPIHYVTRPDGAPPGADGLIAAAVGRASAATGLRFVNDGHTTEGASKQRPALQPDPVRRPVGTGVVRVGNR